MQRKNIVGLRVRKARKESKITQMELAAQMQLLGITIDRSAIAKIESGRRPVSDIEIAAISRILKVSIASLFEDCSQILSH
jgi:transcriptional regulator with XRE-family HTH domain